MIDTDNSRKSKGAEFGAVAAWAGFAVIGIAATTAIRYSAEELPRLEREKYQTKIGQIAKNARPIGEDAFVLSPNFGEFHDWEKTEPGKHPDPRFPDTLKDCFEKEHPSLKVVAILDEKSPLTLSRSPRFEDLNKALRNLKGEQLIFVVSQR